MMNYLSQMMRKQTALSPILCRISARFLHWHILNGNFTTQTVCRWYIQHFNHMAETLRESGSPLTGLIGYDYQQTIRHRTNKVLDAPVCAHGFQQTDHFGLTDCVTNGFNIILSCTIQITDNIFKLINIRRTI